ncbi:pirin family protein [Clostridium sp. SM-530-WT-3G]|uniref:pirin family protein n=1 Tax=Clostridium sp. SM-530-WT-3G TaxID=2725303 RepID=UPI00145E2E29|nr:pirin family protein [Clostridium sp. SM-530-WT-3G]NME81928.1 pirin family protein [Clostridium sp. SM-530-WT-3G]
MNRKVIYQTKGQKSMDGAGVSLVRVLGNDTADIYDPFLMLDAFDSTNPADYEKGFPMHPHRGIETVSFVSKGQMLHRDHLGTEATVHDGEAQWLTAGSGAYHEEMPGGERLLGTQLWLNLPAKDKMVAAPTYHGISVDEIKEFPLEGGKLRLITGNYKDEIGWQGKYLPLDFYDIHLEPHAKVEIPVREGWSAFLFTLLGDIKVSGTEVSEKTAAKLGEGDSVILETGDHGAEVLLYSSKKLDEPVAWYGPIVMNTQKELLTALDDIDNGSFIKKNADYES